MTEIEIFFGVWAVAGTIVWAVLGTILLSNHWYPVKTPYPVMLFMAGPFIWVMLFVAIWYVKLVEKYWK